MSSVMVLVRGKVPPPALTSFDSFATVQIGFSYTSSAPTVTGGLAPLTFSAPLGLPNGLSVNSTTGVISGTFSGGSGESETGAIYNTQLRVTDARGLTSDGGIAFSMFTAPVIRIVSRSQPVNTGTSVGVAFLRNGNDLFPNIVLGPTVNGWAFPSVGYTNTIGDLYEARVASTSGAITGLNGRAVGTWYAIDDVTANFGRTPLNAAGVMNLEIRRKSDGVVVATGTFTYS